jgi:hypothetical protein
VSSTPSAIPQSSAIPRSCPGTGPISECSPAPNTPEQSAVISVLPSSSWSSAHSKKDFKTAKSAKKDLKYTKTDILFLKKLFLLPSSLGVLTIRTLELPFSSCMTNL